MASLQNYNWYGLDREHQDCAHVADYYSYLAQKLMEYMRGQHPAPAPDPSLSVYATCRRHAEMYKEWSIAPFSQWEVLYIIESN